MKVVRVDASNLPYHCDGTEDVIETWGMQENGEIDIFLAPANRVNSKPIIFKYIYGEPTKITIWAFPGSPEIPADPNDEKIHAIPAIPANSIEKINGTVQEKDEFTNFDEFMAIQYYPDGVGVNWILYTWRCPMMES